MLVRKMFICGLYNWLKEIVSPDKQKTDNLFS